MSSDMKNLYEIFDEFEAAPSRQGRIEVLRNNAGYALREVLRGAFHPNIKFVIDKVPYYKPSDAPPGLGYTSIHQELGRAYLFEEDNPKVSPNLSYQRKEQVLIQILEALEKREAEIYMNMLLKNLKIKGLDSKIVREAFPDLL
jgi:hypothetical protein